ncbi:MAG: GGDEF domain-containing protein [Spirochaetaceae bacterium]|jgi:diguanylate cyclase (GGDEF)-like protein|nr:GGDEF domain-containing protein [Spirochaetaceae bacterium]
MEKRDGVENAFVKDAAASEKDLPRKDAGPDTAPEEYRALRHIWELLHQPRIPELDDTLADIPLLREIHRELAEIRQVMKSYTSWELEQNIESRGILPGYLKAFQSNLRHIIWRIQIVRQGDMTPQSRSMGAFSDTFNRMVQQLDMALKELREKEEKLLSMTENLQQEVSQRDSVVEALQESESRFRYLAGHDALTGALNRRSFIERATIELQAAITQNRICCLAIMDIDHFKLFNDRHDHLAGDEALRHVVKVMSAYLRKMDFMGRYGGEEFVFFFQGTDLETGHIVCERVRKNLASAPLELESGPVHITASFGVTMTTLEEFDAPPEGANFSLSSSEIIRKLVDRADKALYQAKKAGRNRVVSYHGGLEDRPAHDGGVETVEHDKEAL